VPFGTEWGFDTDEEGALALFDRYLEQGGNFLDTTDGYTNGESEEMAGEGRLEKTKRSPFAKAYTHREWHPWCTSRRGEAA
jgi:aryl-alcohol dehydrogenase-like predicted oxidoreductase